MKIVDEKDFVLPSYDALQARIAIRHTIDMWTDMQTELGENPSPYQRVSYKVRWCKEHVFTGWNRPDHECFLCEFACAALLRSTGPASKCDFCPIRWPLHAFVPELFTEEYYYDMRNDEEAVHLTPRCICHRVDYMKAPLSDILEYLRDESNWRYE